MELLPRDVAPLSATAEQVLRALYDTFDVTAQPVDELTLILKLKPSLQRAASTVASALGGPELAPYVNREASGFTPTLRAAIRLDRQEDLAAASQLYALCHQKMLERVQRLEPHDIPSGLRERLPRLRALLSWSFATIDIPERYPSMPSVQISQRVLDADNLAEYLTQQSELQPRTAVTAPALPMAALRLTGFSIEQFRSFSRAAVDQLGALTVLAGPNEAGKTNVFRALKFAARASADGFGSALAAEGGLQSCLRRDEQDRPLSVRLVLEQTGLEGSLVYATRVGRKDDWVEGLVHFPEPVSALALSALDGRKQTLWSQQHGSVTSVWVEPHIEKPKLAEGQSLLASLSDLSKFEKHIGVREALRSWRFYAFEPSALRQEQPGANGTLQADGRNLPAALNALAQKAPERFEEVARAFVDLLPATERLSSEVNLANRPVLHLRERGLVDPLTHVDFSDGMLKLLALLYLAMQPEPPRAVFIEEPENGLYPRLIEAMVEVLRMLSRRSQVFITTHSVSLLNRVAPEETLFVHRDDAGSRLERLDSRDDVKKFIGRFGLGAQLMMGNLEASR